jgi:hypothetical protein
MSKSYISADLRRLAMERADNLCEYCLIHENDTFFGCEVDHIISEKHSGPTHADNLAYACFSCNRAKGSDIGSIIWRTGDLVRFFNPRTDLWAKHFALSVITIMPLTDIGEVTSSILDFNNNDRLLERETMQNAGRYPSPAALKRISETSASADGNQEL